MIAQGYGRIVNCASGAFMGDRFFDDFALLRRQRRRRGFTRAIAEELYSRGITANAFCPHRSHEAERPNRKKSVCRKAEISARPRHLHPRPFIIFLCSKSPGT
jgi:NAD(P)-dependent dehydrogenase (short-subunit alcohol dehydrogenase family)